MELRQPATIQNMVRRLTIAENRSPSEALPGSYFSAGVVRSFRYSPGATFRK